MVPMPPAGPPGRAPVGMVMPTGPPAPAGSPPGIVPRAVPPCVPGPVPGVPAEAPAPAADRERRPPRPAPAVIPRIEQHDRSPPRSEHRSDVLGLDPHLVTHDDDVVESRIVGRGIGEGRTVAGIDVARRHPVGRRLEAPQAARIGALVVIGQDALVRIRIGTPVFVVVIFCRSGLGLGDPGLPLGSARLGFSLLGFGLGLLFACDLRAVVLNIQVVAGIPRRGVICRRAACETRSRDDGGNP